MYFIFRSRATFILEESSETILLFVDSGGSEVCHVPLDVGTIERRCAVTVLVKPLPESPFLGLDSENSNIPSSSLSCTNKHYVRDMQDC